jgi:hypothetical protein
MTAHSVTGTGIEIVLIYYGSFLNVELTSFENKSDSRRTRWSSISLQSIFTDLDYKLCHRFKNLPSYEKCYTL